MADETTVTSPASCAEFLWVTGGVAVALLVAPVSGGLVNGIGPVFGIVVVSALTVAFGSAVVPLLRLPTRVPQALAWVVVGYGAASLVHLGATALLNVSAAMALPIDVAGAVAVCIAARKTWPQRAERGGSNALARVLPALAVLVGCAGLSAFWARETIAAVPHAQATGIFPAWQDYFLHAAEISYIRDYPSFGGRSQYLTSIPQPLYHRGSYALSAVVSAIGDVPSLEMATAYWMPTGLLLTMCATFVLGAVLGGAFGGVGAVVAVFLTPDASSYGFENRFLSFHWLMQMAAGSGYAVAIVALGLAAVIGARPGGQARAFVVASGLALAASAFRVHVGLLAMGTIGWLILLSWRWRPSIKEGAWLAAGLAVTWGALVWMESLELAPHFFTGLSHPVVFFRALHSQLRGLASPFTAWTAGRPDWWTVLVGFAMMLVAGCGASIGVLGIVARTGVLNRSGGRAGTVAVAGACALFSVILVVPTPAHGDVTDLGHRPFVLVYLVIGALAGAAASTLLAEWSQRRFSGLTPAALGVALLTVVGLVVPWRVGAKVQQRWMPSYSLIFVSPSVFEVGAFVRNHSAPGEQVLAASQDPQAALVALTERRAYLSRMPLYQLLRGDAAASAEARAESHATIAAITSFEQLKAFGARTGVMWYIADTPGTHLWPTSVTSRSVFTSGGLRVYDLR